MMMKIVRRALILTVAIALPACFLAYHYHFTKAEVVGSYEEEGLEAGAVFDVRSDGTFTRIDGKEQDVGTWRLIDADFVLFDTGIEFDGGPKGAKYADSYLLTRRAMRVCWEVREDQDYFCKKGQ